MEHLMSSEALGAIVSRMYTGSWDLEKIVQNFELKCSKFSWGWKELRKYRGVTVFTSTSYALSWLVKNLSYKGCRIKSHVVPTYDTIWTCPIRHKPPIVTEPDVFEVFPEYALTELLVNAPAPVDEFEGGYDMGYFEPYRHPDDLDELANDSLSFDAEVEDWLMHKVKGG